MTVFKEYLRDPAYDVIPVTKADADLPEGSCKAILVGQAGTLNIQTVGRGSPEIRTSVPLAAGIYPFQCKQIRTGGTADNIWAIY
jgi:hypothetical protein